MTESEFKIQYERLTSVHPNYFSSSEKMNTIWEYVKDLSSEWFRRKVDNIIMATNPNSEKYDIGAAAIGERNAIKSLKFAEDVCAASKLLDKMTDEGLNKALKAYKSDNLWHAIEKSRKGSL